MERRAQPRDTACVGKRPPRWPKDHQSPAWRGARRRPDEPENTQRSAGALDWWKLVWQARRRRAPDWPAGLSRGCGAVGRWGRSRLCRQSGPAGSFRAAHPCAAYAPVKRNGCALPLAGPRGHQPVSPTFSRLALPGGRCSRLSVGRDWAVDLAPPRATAGCPRHSRKGDQGEQRAHSRRAARWFSEASCKGARGCLWQTAQCEWLRAGGSELAQSWPGRVVRAPGYSIVR